MIRPNAHGPAALAVALLLHAAPVAQDSITVLRGARVLTGRGQVIENGTVTLASGRIVAVGDATLEIPGGATVVDCSGKVLTPGLVDASTTLGIAGDPNEQSDEITAALTVLDAIDPKDKGLARALRAGVTTVQVNPGNKNVIGGLGAVIKTHGATVERMLVREDSGLRLTMGLEPTTGNRAVRGGTPASLYYRRPTTRMGVIWETRQAFYQAKAYAEQKTIPNAPPPPVDADLEILLRALRGELIVRTTARAEQDIRTAIRLASEFGYRTVLEESTEAWSALDAIVEASVPVLLSSPSRSFAGDGADVRWATARMLAQRGVPFAICSGADGGGLELAREAMFAVRFGLDRDTALRSITSEAARLLAVDDRVGALAAGLDADVVLWSGDPFDPTSSVVSVWVGGERVVR
jgi:imidazolonepropionase-like amidohydrolase